MSKRRQLFKYITPAIISMMSIFLYTIVDGIFVGRGVGATALAAVNIAYSYTLFFVALTSMFTIGGMTITAIRMGRGDTDGANISFLHSLALCLALGVLFTLFGTCATEPICRLLGAKGIYLESACDYLFWLTLFNLPSGLFILFCATLRNDGRPVIVSAAVIVSSVCNIFGDWLLIFPFQMGVKGAAIATGVSQLLGLAILLFHFFMRKGVLRLKFVRLEMPLVGKIILRGIPECVSQFSVPVTVVAMTHTLHRYLGNVGINAFALICYVAILIQAIGLGVAEGLQPLFGRAYGAKSEEDLAYFLRSGLAVSFLGSVVIMALLFAVCLPIYSFFRMDEATLAMALKATHIYSIGFLVQSLTVIITSYLYSTTKTSYAVAINTLRSFVVNLVVIISLPIIFGANSIWFTSLVFEGIVLVLAFAMLAHADRNGMIPQTQE